MADTYPKFMFSTEGKRLFKSESEHGPNGPKGWYDSPDQVPHHEETKGDDVDTEEDAGTDDSADDAGSEEDTGTEKKKAKSKKTKKGK